MTLQVLHLTDAEYVEVTTEDDIHRISLPTMLKKSKDLHLRDTKRFASYQRLVCKR